MTIYALTDPRDGSTRYIGKTAQPLQKRLMQHISLHYATDAKAAWIQSLADRGLSPTIIPLQVVPQDEGLRAERRHIREHLAKGSDLINERNIKPDRPAPAYIEREKQRLASMQPALIADNAPRIDSMTLEEAAAKIGYKDTSGLRHAIRRGVLRAVQRGKMYFTTQQWLDEYAAHVEANRGGRGKTRKPRAPEESS